MKPLLTHVQLVKWQSGQGRSIAIVRLSLRQFTEQFGVVFREGVDDLDEYEDAAIQLPSGRVAVLVRHKGEPEDTVTLEIDSNDDVDSARRDLYRTLGVGPESLEWEGDALS